MGDTKWIDENQLILIDEENNPEYDTFDEYVEANLDSLINHKVENIDEAELAEHILDMYQYTNNTLKIRNHIKNLYKTIFMYIYLPIIQSYWMRNEISDELSYIEDYLKIENDKIKEFIVETSLKEIEYQKSFYKDWYKIKKNVEVATADILVDTFIEDIISKYAFETDLVIEYVV